MTTEPSVLSFLKDYIDDLRRTIGTRCGRLKPETWELSVPYTLGDANHTRYLNLLVASLVIWVNDAIKIGAITAPESTDRPAWWPADATREQYGALVRSLPAVNDASSVDAAICYLTACLNAGPNWDVRWLMADQEAEVNLAKWLEVITFQISVYAYVLNCSAELQLG